MISTALPSAAVWFSIRVGMASGDRFGGRPDMTAAPCTAWCNPQLIEKALIRRTARVRIVWLCQRHRERHQARSIESRIDAREVVDRADQQARANDEHHRQRDFDHNERAADVMASSAARPSIPALLERGHEVIDPSLP